MIEAAELPSINAQVLRDPDKGNLMLTLLNSGRGVAPGVNFILHANGQAVQAHVGDGFLPAGEGVMVTTEISLPAPVPDELVADIPDIAVLVAYRDARGFVHYRTHTGVERVPRTLIRRRPKYPRRFTVLKELYPDIDVQSAKLVGHNIGKRPS